MGHEISRADIGYYSVGVYPRKKCLVWQINSYDFFLRFFLYYNNLSRSCACDTQRDCLFTLIYINSGRLSSQRHQGNLLNNNYFIIAVSRHNVLIIRISRLRARERTKLFHNLSGAAAAVLC